MEQQQYEKKSGMGCFAKGCLTVVTFIGVILLGFYLAIFHTAWPANMAKKLIASSDAPLELGKIRGSIRSGFSLDWLAYTHTNGHVSKMELVGFEFERIPNGILIKDIHVKSAHLFIDWSDPDSTKGEFSAATSESGDSGGDETGASGPYAFVAIDKIDINDVRIENPRNGEVVQVDAIHLDGFKTTHKGTVIGTMRIKSPSLDIRIDPTGETDRKGMSSSFTLTGDIQPAVHSNILQAIAFKGEFDMAKDDAELLSLSALNGNISLETIENDKVRMIVKDLTPRDYVRTTHPIEAINLDLVGDHDDESIPTINRATFRIADTLFTATEFAEAAEGDAAEDRRLVARAKTDRAEYTCLVDKDGKNIKLSTQPEMPLNDALSTLLLGERFDELDAAGKQKVEAAAVHFTDTTVAEAADTAPAVPVEG